MTRTHSVFSRKGSNPKIVVLHVLFSIQASCVPLLDKKSQWHLSQWALGFRLQYDLPIPCFSTKLILCSCPDAEDLKMMRMENHEEQSYSCSVHECSWCAIHRVQEVKSWHHEKRPKDNLFSKKAKEHTMWKTKRTVLQQCCYYNRNSLLYFMFYFPGLGVHYN